MDKLEPILKQKFWIILGVGMILTIVGWWMATGSLAATIAARKTAIEDAEKKIPSGELPNESWSSQLAAINSRQETMVQSVRRQMWEQQAATMFWPENVQEFAAELPYRGDFNLVARNLYRSNYMFAVESAWRQVRPIELDGSGIVQFPIEKMPIRQAVLGDLAPSSGVIWDAQEDLWLTIPILQAIREVNGGENATRGDASVHIISNFELMGGERLQGEAPAGGGDMGSPDMGMAMGGMMGGGGGGRSGDGRPLPADFSPEEEFGNTGREKSSGSSGGGGMGLGGMAMEGGADAGGGEAPQTRRYVDDTEGVPYKTRAFYLSVVMDHRKVPHLLGQLTAGGNSPWPIEIVRVQMSRVNPDDAEGRTLGNPMLAGAPTDPGAGVANEFAPADGIDGFALPMVTSPNPRPAVQQLSLDVVLQDPYISRVAIAGLIYLYRPVDPPVAESTDPAATEGAAPSSESVPATDASLADPGMAAPVGTDPAVLDPGAAPPAATTTPLDSAPADPAATGTPATPAPVDPGGSPPPTSPPAGTTPEPSAPASTTPTPPPGS